MDVKVTQLTSWSLALDAARVTMGKIETGKEPSDMWKRKLLASEHSVIRRVRYQIDLVDIPYYVSVHLVRHKVGVEHFVKSQRDDRSPNRSISRSELSQSELVHHMMDINAAAVMTISRRRLCGQADRQTFRVWDRVRQEMTQVDPILAEFMVPMCLYRGGVCSELTPCGFLTHRSVETASKL